MIRIAYCVLISGMFFTASCDSCTSKRIKFEHRESKLFSQSPKFVAVAESLRLDEHRIVTTFVSQPVEMKVWVSVHSATEEQPPDVVTRVSCGEFSTEGKRSSFELDREVSHHKWMSAPIILTKEETKYCYEQEEIVVAMRFGLADQEATKTHVHKRRVSTYLNFPT